MDWAAKVARLKKLQAEVTALNALDDDALFEKMPEVVAISYDVLAEVDELIETLECTATS